MWRKAEKHLKKDKYIGPLIKKYGPCQITPRKHINYFQALVSAIVGQQLSGKAAETIYGRVKEKVKGRITPKKILEVSEQDLRDCGMSWAKVASVRDLAQHVLDRRLHVRSLESHTDEDVMRELVAVKGIGPWTAEMFMMFTLGRQDIFSPGDLGLKKGLEKVTGRKRDPKQMEKFAQRWKPYRTVASWYLWRVVDN